MTRKRRYLSNAGRYEAPVDNTAVVINRYPLNRGVPTVTDKNRQYLRSLYAPAYYQDNVNRVNDNTYQALDSVLLQRAYDYDAALRAANMGIPAIPLTNKWYNIRNAKARYNQAKNNFNSYRNRYYKSK